MTNQYRQLVVNRAEEKMYDQLKGYLKGTFMKIRKQAYENNDKQQLQIINEL